MTRAYYEDRQRAARGTDSLAADMMRHLYTRQHLGKAIVVCEHPAAMLSASRKQWLKLGRTVQKQRSSTLNAEKLLKYTHTISRMHHMKFTIRTPFEDPEADIYYAHCASIETLPVQCMSMYIVTSPSKECIQKLVEQLPAEALVIDYEHRLSWQDSGLEPKAALEETVKNEWRQVMQFLESQGIKLRLITENGLRNAEAMDDVLDTLLGGVGPQFLQVAAEFQRAIELARPLKLDKSLRQQYDMVILLAHRVQALSSSAFTQQFLQSYNEDDTYFLYDSGRGRKLLPDRITDLIAHHQNAGRQHLAKALHEAAAK